MIDWGDDHDMVNDVPPSLLLLLLWVSDQNMTIRHVSVSGSDDDDDGSRECIASKRRRRECDRVHFKGIEWNVKWIRSEGKTGIYLTNWRYKFLVGIDFLEEL